jgi:hypothetical protein
MYGKNLAKMSKEMPSTHLFGKLYMLDHYIFFDYTSAKSLSLADYVPSLDGAGHFQKNERKIL